MLIHVSMKKLPLLLVGAAVIILLIFAVFFLQKKETTPTGDDVGVTPTTSVEEAAEGAEPQTEEAVDPLDETSAYLEVLGELEAE